MQLASDSPRRARSIGTTTGAPILPIERVVLPLLELADGYTVTSGDPQGVDIRVMSTRGSFGEGDFGARSALAMSPPAEVRFEIPELPDRARLEFAVGVGKGYQGQGEVTFEVDGKGVTVHRARVGCPGSVEAAERRWWPAGFDLQGEAGTLALRARYEGEREEPPTAGFARLEVVLPAEVRLTPSSAERPNLILVVIDTLRADRLHSYGHPRPVSPNIDRLAERGALFERAYASSSWTVPSTASILTSLSPPEHGKGFSRSNALSESLTTLADLLLENGVATGGFSCNPLISEGRNFDQGFHSFRCYSWKDTVALLEDVQGWIEAQREHRFFLYLHLVEPHYPYGAPPDLVERFASSAFQSAELPSLSTISSAIARGEELEGVVDLPALVSDYSALYDAEVAWVDRSLGQVLECLRELDLEGKTVVAVTSDHGEEFLEHGLTGHKHQLHEELVRVPLVLAGPGVPEGRRFEERVENRFLAPTLLRLAGIEPGGSLTGSDLLDDRERAAESKKGIFFKTGHGYFFDEELEAWVPAAQICGLLLEERLFFWSRAQDPERGEHFALFDLTEDPSASTNIAGERPAAVRLLLRRIHAWLRRGREWRPVDNVSGEADRELMRQLGYLGDE